MLLALLAPGFLGAALAGSHVPTFAVDQRYTPAPFAGMEKLVVEPAQALAQIKPLSAPLADTVERVRNGAAPGVNSIVFTNPTSNWADLTLGGVVIGEIGPYNTITFDGVPRGNWQLDLRFASGFVRSFVVTD